MDESPSLPKLMAFSEIFEIREENGIQEKGGGGKQNSFNLRKFSMEKILSSKNHLTLLMKPKFTIRVVLKYFFLILRRPLVCPI